MEEEGRNIGFLQNPSYVFLYLAALKAKSITFECGPIGQHCKETADGGLQYEIPIHKGYDFLEAIKFPMAVVDLEIREERKEPIRLTPVHPERGISKVDFKIPVPSSYTATKIVYKLDVRQFQNDTFRIGLENSPMGYPIFTMKLVQPDQRILPESAISELSTAVVQ